MADTSIGDETMSMSYFLQITGIDGESTDAGHVGDIEVESFSLEVGFTPSGPGSGGGGGGVATFSPLQITVPADSTEAALLLDVSRGAVLAAAQLMLVPAGSDAASYTFSLDDVIVTELDLSGDEAGPSEHFELTYGRISLVEGAASGPAPSLPEVPLVAALPLAAGVAGGALLLRRRSGAGASLTEGPPAEEGQPANEGWDPGEGPVR